MIKPHTKFEVSKFMHYEDMKGKAKCRKWVVWGIRGQWRSPAMSPFDRAHTTSYLTLNRNYASILYRFRVIASYSSKVADFNLLHLNLASALGWSGRILRRSLAAGNYSHCAIVWCYLRDRMFSRFDTIPACDGLADRRTDTRWRL